MTIGLIISFIAFAMVFHWVTTWARFDTRQHIVLLVIVLFCALGSWAQQNESVRECAEAIEQVMQDVQAR